MAIPPNAVLALAQSLSTHPNSVTAIGFALMAIGAIPLLWGAIWTLMLTLQTDEMIWRIGLIVCWLIFGGCFFIQAGDLRYIIGCGGILLPTLFGIVFCRRYWEDAYRACILWVGGTIWFLLGTALRLALYIANNSN